MENQALRAKAAEQIKERQAKNNQEGLFIKKDIVYTEYVEGIGEVPEPEPRASYEINPNYKSKKIKI